MPYTRSLQRIIFVEEANHLEEISEGEQHDIALC